MKCCPCQQDAPSDTEFCPADHKYCKKRGQPLLTAEAPLAERMSTAHR